MDNEKNLDLPRIVTKKRFLNAFHICKKYCEKTKNIRDANFRLVKPHILSLSEAHVETFYNKYIATELVFSLPELHSCEKIIIPKNSTGTREYRYFTTFSMILYNAVGLNIVDACDDAIKSLSFNEKSIYPYYPTKFKKKDGKHYEWEVSNDYRDEYKKYFCKLQELTQKDCALLQIDITQYFDSIVHENLIQLVYEYANKSSLSKNHLDSASQQTMEFYFEALMLKRLSIPQGRKNFVSDYFGYFYLIPFDMNIKKICSGFKLSFKGMIRYVDDITIIFDNPHNIDASEVFRELLAIESKVINWILNNLGLNINPSKTVRKYLKSNEEAKVFIEENKKSISSIELLSSEDSGLETSKSEDKVSHNIEDKFKEFLSILKTFKFPKDNELNIELKKSDRENLKYIYDKTFQQYLLKKNISQEVFEVLESVEVELTVDIINILIALFLLKNIEGNFLYRRPIDKFLNNNFNPSDKRHIHIMHIIITQYYSDSESVVFYNLIKKFNADLARDNYGKYLLIFAAVNDNMPTVRKNIVKDSLDENFIYYDRIYNEYTSEKVMFHHQYLFPSEDPYQRLIKAIIEKELYNQAISDQLKNYILHKRLKKWDLSFNYFHNFFHEIAKTKLKLKDTSTVKKISGNPIFSLDEQLTINKFYSRRNFNSISHPSHKDIPAEKADKNDLEYFEVRIIDILFKLLNLESKD